LLSARSKPFYSINDMNRQNNKKNKNPPKGNQGPWGQIRLGGFKAEFPQPRLPRLLGAAVRLGNNLSVYPNLSLDVPLQTEILSIVAGTLAGVIPLDITSVKNFIPRFSPLFKEYAIVGARIEIRPNNMANTSGLTGAFIDEESSAVPTAAQTSDVGRLDLNNAPLFQVKPYRLDWTPRDILDLDYVSTLTTFTPAWLKLFTNVADFGSQSTTTGQWLITGSLAFVFRGYA